MSLKKPPKDTFRGASKTALEDIVKDTLKGPL